MLRRARFVADHYGRRAADVRALGAGAWSRAYAFILDGHAAVIRFGQHVEDFRKDQVMAAHSCAALPVPAVLEIGSADDGYFAVSQRAHGDPLDGDVSRTQGDGIWTPDRSEARSAAPTAAAR